eukprot:91539_1
MHYRQREQDNVLLPNFSHSKSTNVDQHDIISTDSIYDRHCPSTICLKRPPWLQSSHKLFFLKHIISNYLLSYEQYRIAPTSKALYQHICNESTYNESMFIRDAMYWNHYSHSHAQIDIDFLHTLKSMDTSRLMQLKYIVIYLHKINAYIAKKADEHLLNEPLLHLIQHPLHIDVLALSTFIKPQMLIHQERDSFRHLNRLQYMCDILQHGDFSSIHNTIQHIDLSDNSLNHKDLFAILNAMRSNSHCIQFSNVLSLDISHNLFIEDSYALCNELFTVIGTHFPNLSTLNLSNTGVPCASVLDAMWRFHDAYPTHSLQLLNVKHCEAWCVTQKELNRLSDIPITVLYDEATPHETEEYFEFGFDCTATTDDNETTLHDTDTTAHVIKLSAQQCTDHTPSQFANYLHYPSHDSDDDDDGFVYL